MCVCSGSSVFGVVFSGGGGGSGAVCSGMAGKIEAALQKEFGLCFGRSHSHQCVPNRHHFLVDVLSRRCRRFGLQSPFVDQFCSHVHALGLWMD